ncbi:ABC transporter ATP-binding protein [Pengzhenrongella sp.]|uniref:ABC transporter ATP-binding protein n=1 Tax=Pengzhenrongella sp. TaxID=2888820 RepID=UPI002F92EF6C
MSDPAGLSIEDLTLSIDGRSILDGVDLEVAPGRITGLAGESGSGKTLTGMSIIGLPPERAVLGGAIRYGGANLLELGDKKRNALRGAQIAMVFQDPAASLHPMMSIGTQLTDHVRYHLRLSRSGARERLVDLLRQVRVPDPEGALRKYPHQFSGGQLQRIAIAGAIACEPKVLVADEPTTALDVTVQAGILHLLRGLCDNLGLTIVLITHDLGVMSALADQIAVMRHGKVVEFGNRADVIQRPAHPYTRSLIDALPDRVAAASLAAKEVG